MNQIYHNGHNSESLYFQIQFFSVVCTPETKQQIEGRLKSSRNLLCQKRKESCQKSS